MERRTSRTQPNAQSNAGVFARKYVILLLCIAAAFFSVWFMYKLVGRGGAPGSSNTTSTICCTDVVAALARTVNTSLDPCKNFHDYVCSNVITFNEKRYMLSWDYYRNAVEKELKPVVSVPAGMSLVRYRKSCMAVKSASELVAQFTTAFIRDMDVKVTMSDGEIGRFILLVGLRYNFGSVIDFRYSKGSETVVSNIGEYPTLTNGGQITSTVLRTFNGELKTNVSMEQLTALESKIYRTAQNSGALVAVNFTALHDIFPGTPRKVWDEVAVYLGEETPEWHMAIKVATSDLRSLLPILTNPRNQPASIVYMIYAAVYFASRVLTDFGGVKQVDACTKHLSRITSLWDVLLAEIVSNDARDNYMRMLYSDVKEAVLKAAIKQKIIRRKDSGKTSPLSKLELLVPRVRSVADLPVPSMNSDFASNTISSLRHATLSFRTKIRRKLPTFASPLRLSVFPISKYIFISPEFYDYSYFDRPYGMFLDVPFIGVRLASAFYYVLVTRSGSETKENFLALQRCFEKNYFRHQPNGKGSLFGALDTLALSSVLDIAKTYDWNGMKQLGSWKLSLGMLYYMRYADVICSNSMAHSVVDKINMPLMFSEDFARTFSCKKGSEMTPNVTCWL